MSGLTYFISYAGPDVQFASEVAHSLEKMGHTTIFGVRDFSQEVDFVSSITNALVECNFVIALISENYITSTWCVKEFQIAKEHDKLIPILIETLKAQTPILIHKPLDVSKHNRNKAVVAILEGIRILQLGLSPIPIDASRCFKEVEKVIILLPKRNDKNSPIDVLVGQLNAMLRSENVEITLVPNLATEAEASALLKKHNADFGLFGSKNDYLDNVSIVFSRGWSVLSHEATPRSESWEGFVGGSEYLAFLVLIAISNLHKARGNSTKAVQCLHLLLHWLHIHPRDMLRAPFLHWLRAGVFERLGDWRNVVDEMSCGLVFYGPGKESAIAQAFRGEANFELGRYNEALQDCTQAIKEDSTHIHAYVVRSEIHSAMQNYHLALIDIDKAISLGGKSGRIYDDRGAINTWLGDIAEAVKDFTKLIKLNPSYAEAYRRRGMSYERLGLLNEALADYLRYGEISKDNSPRHHRAIALVKAAIAKRDEE